MSNYEIQNTVPITIYVAIAKEGSLRVSILIEAEQRMITGILEVAVVDRAFLTAVGRDDRTVHIKDDILRRAALLNPVYTRTG
jgi:hypothetical protein